MQFCKECGGALNLFESNDENICWTCVRKEEKHKKPPKEQASSSDVDELSEATLSFENNMLVLKAQEGWILWSGPETQTANLGAIMKRARHIYAIRKKRQQNNN